MSNFTNVSKLKEEGLFFPAAISLIFWDITLSV